MKTLADSSQIEQMISSLAEGVTAHMNGDSQENSWAIVGIRSRGDIIAKRLASQIDRSELLNDVGVLDITLYRDDLSEITSQPVVRTTEIPFAVDGLDIVLVDDVLMTGRSIRAALQSLMDFGRPRRVWLAVLVDRGGRELPICPDFCSMKMSDKDVPTGHIVQVQLAETDQADQIVLSDKESTGES